MKIWKTFYCRSLKPEFCLVNIFIENKKNRNAVEYLSGYQPSLLNYLIQLTKNPKKKLIFLFSGGFLNKMGLKLRGVRKGRILIKYGFSGITIPPRLVIMV